MYKTKQYKEGERNTKLSGIGRMGPMHQQTQSSKSMGRIHVLSTCQLQSQIASTLS